MGSLVSRALEPLNLCFDPEMETKVELISRGVTRDVLWRMVVGNKVQQQLGAQLGMSRIQAGSDGGRK
jgi:hypothetical protein